MPDFYEVLQVNPRAEDEVIRAAYRVLARKYHPDHGGDAGRMIALNDAWDVLGDPERRAAYDATRPGSSGRQAASPASSAASTAGASSPSASESGRATGPAATGGSAESMHAGPPPGNPSGTVLDFGRYAGWSLGEIARRDLVYLEWLGRATVGRRLRAEIDALLRQRGAVPGGGATSRPWGHR